MARSVFVLFSLLVTVLCLLQVATAYDLNQSVLDKANRLIVNNDLTCASYTGYCRSNPSSYANVQDVDGVDVSVVVCKIAIRAALGC